MLARSGTASRTTRRSSPRPARTKPIGSSSGSPVAVGQGWVPPSAATLDEIEELRAAAPDDITVDCYDERFTTVIAQRSLCSPACAVDARKQVVDKVAAAVMLQSYLEAQP